AAIRQNIDKGIARQKWMYRIIFFGMHVFFYLVTMLAVWGVVLTNSQLRDVLFNSGLAAAVIVLMPTILWTAVILFHVASLYTETDAGEKSIRERLLMREIGEEILRKGLVEQGISEKPKRRVSLSESD